MVFYVLEREFIHVVVAFVFYHLAYDFECRLCPEFFLPNNIQVVDKDHRMTEEIWTLYTHFPPFQVLVD